MTDIRKRIEAALPGRLLSAEQQPADAKEDICRRPLGDAIAWVRPQQTDEVARVVKLAREHRVPVVPVGGRTAYWGPLRLEGAIALDLTALKTVSLHEDARAIRCGAGATFRDLDAVADESGLELAILPDAHGGTPVAGLVSTAFTSGLGMGAADIGSVLLGLTVVLGSGEVLRTGAAQLLGAEAFIRHGLPDPSGLFFASEGALGVIAEVTLRLRPRLHRARLSCALPPGLRGHRLALALAKEMRRDGIYDTFRAEEHASVEGEQSSVRLDLDLIAPGGEAELGARVSWVRELMTRHISSKVDVLREAPDEARAIPRYWGAAGELWPQLRQGRLAGVDVNLGYAAAEGALALSEELLASAAGAPHLDLRRALYFAPGFVNLGLHFLFREDQQEAAAAFEARGAMRMAELGVVPYRWGRIWNEALGSRLDPSYREQIRALKRVLDPDGIMHPGVSVFGEH